MSLYILFFIFCLIAVFIFFMRHIQILNNAKKIIGIFWFLLLSILLYGMFFETTRGFIILFKQGFWVVICIFLAGIVSIFIEARYKNTSIVYFLFWYFGIPILYAISVSYSLLKDEITLQTFSKLISYISFLLFSLLCICGFISYIKKKYKVLVICFVICVFFYFPFLPIAVYLLFF